MALLRARRQQKYDFADKARWPSKRSGFDLRLTNRVSRAPTPRRERREEALAMAGGSRWAGGGKLMGAMGNKATTTPRGKSIDGVLVL